MTIIKPIMDAIFRYRILFKLLVDLVLWAGLTSVAFVLRFDGQLSGWGGTIMQLTFTLIGVKAIALIVSGVERASWRNVGFLDLFRLTGMVSAVTIIELAIVMALRQSSPLPLSIPILEGLLAVSLLSMLRLATRYVIVYKDWRSLIKPIQSTDVRTKRRNRVVIVGAGEAGTLSAREMLRNPQAGLMPVGFVDDDSSKEGRRIVGIPVLGPTPDLARVCREMNADEVLIAMPSQTGQVMRRTVRHAQSTGLKFRTLPGLFDLISGKVQIEQIRNVNVEDLLRRKAVHLDRESIGSYLYGRRVLVTGAGGSIGSEIVRQLLPLGPKSVALLGRGENSVHELYREVGKLSDEVSIRPVICDVRDRVSLERVFERERPEVVFHAAAHKHVYLMEENPEQAIFNNVFGTRNVVQLCLEHGVQRLVNVSTDKAVNPTSVMGASKRIAEQVVVRGSRDARRGQVFTSVRFGNVLGSRGSVIPIFREQIRRGGPVTVTHPNMVRYFMTIPEASQLVIQAGALADNGKIYVLDMGEPVRIADMARDLIRLSGFEPDVDIKIEYTGMKPGEKLYEELLTSEEGTSMSQHESIFVARSEAMAGMGEEEFDRELEMLLDLVTARDASLGGGHESTGFLGESGVDPLIRLRRSVQRLVPAYSNGAVNVPVRQSVKEAAW